MKISKFTEDAAYMIAFLPANKLVTKFGLKDNSSTIGIALALTNIIVTSPITLPLFSLAHLAKTLGH